MIRVRDLRVRPDLLYVSSGWNVLITDVHGRITGQDEHGEQGFYARNTRMISRERITIDGRVPTSFSTANVGAHGQLSYAQLTDSEKLPRQGVYLMLQRFLGQGLRTRLSLRSFADIEQRFTVRVELDADFADVEALSRSTTSGQVGGSWDAEKALWRLDYEQPDLDMALAIRVESPTPVECDGRSLTVELIVPPGREAALDLVAEPVFDGVCLPAPTAGYREPENTAAQARRLLWRELSKLRSTNLDVAAAWQTAIADLACLPLGQPPGPTAPIAGLPIYQQIFGRDTLTAAWQSALAGPTMLRDALLLNAAHIGRHLDDWRDEEPGKMLHQARYGPRSQLGLDPFSSYYGDWSTSPDFLIFLGQYLAWTGDLDTVRELMPAARQAHRWLERFADLDRDGFIEYDTRSSAGVKNQGWKDSDTAIVDENGKQVDNPITTSELQAYYYAALRHSAFAFAAAGDRAYAAALVARSTRLRRKFHDAFWMPDHGCYALALGPDKKQVRSVNSNDGHLLATGIVPKRFARTVARRLLAPDMFSGWGVRTLSSEHAAFDPFSYHRGSVWPVEAGTFAVGLARYGCWEQLHRVAEGIFSAAALFEGHRLPEVLSGLPRDEQHPHPGVYPQSCSPQAWSSSSIIATVHALLVLRPFAPLRTILVDPHLPPWLDDFTIEGVRLGGATFDLSVRRRRGGKVDVKTSGDRIAVLRKTPVAQMMI